jgi:hypothetical protein
MVTFYRHVHVWRQNIQFEGILIKKKKRAKMGALDYVAKAISYDDYVRAAADIKSRVRL